MPGQSRDNPGIILGQSRELLLICSLICCFVGPNLYCGGTDSFEKFSIEFSASAPEIRYTTTVAGEVVKVSVAIFSASGCDA